VNFLQSLTPLLLLVATPACQTSQVNGATTAQLAKVPLEIRTAKGKLKFSVEVARTQEEQNRGLMFRQSLPEFGGMIFPLVPPRVASFWMKDTIIPLDLIFVRSDGTIARIAANAIPYDLTPITSGEPVVAVLEIAGGRAEALGIAENDRVIWKSDSR
jgi:uncharacterized protein